MSKLHNVRGRITYIASHAKQENLYAVYETTDRHYWTELARFNQQEFLKSGTDRREMYRGKGADYRIAGILPRPLWSQQAVTDVYQPL